MLSGELEALGRCRKQEELGRLRVVKRSYKDMTEEGFPDPGEQAPRAEGEWTTKDLGPKGSCSNSSIRW